MMIIITTTIIIITRILIIIQCKCFFLFIGRQPTTWPGNNCLQIMVCSRAMSFNCLWLQILFCSCLKERQPALTAFRRYYLLKNKLSDRMIKQFFACRTPIGSQQTSFLEQCDNARCYQLACLHPRSSNYNTDDRYSSGVPDFLHFHL